MFQTFYSNRSTGCDRISMARFAILQCQLSDVKLDVGEKQEKIMSEQVQEIQSPETSPAMPAEVKESKSAVDNAASPSETSMAWLVLAIEKIPKEYWPNLLQIIRLYGESVALKDAQQKSWDKIKEELKNPDPVVELARQKLGAKRLGLGEKMETNKNKKKLGRFSAKL
ncbi:hypothetical protein HC766_06150 [Candidatus Gracilibacteria bacterium]|nr:hypothetical protein [Candidatus Gracilibacteria bacterium]